MPVWLPGVLLALLVVALFLGGWYLAWRRFGPHLLASPDFQIGPEQVQITQPPAWIRSDIRADVFRQLALRGPLSIMDNDLVNRIGSAFRMHPWVAKVNSVRKRSSVGVTVDLIYRQPVCMVEVHDGPKMGLLPVDAEGVLLPSGDFTSLEAGRYPQLLGVDRQPVGLPAGQHWNDARVIGGAEIAAVLGPVWKDLKLQAIVPAAPPSSPGGAVKDEPNRPLGEYTFWLITRGGSQVFWGYSPSAPNRPGELPAAEKIARLQRYVSDNDSLDGLHGAAQKLDIRTMRP